MHIYNKFLNTNSILSKYAHTYDWIYISTCFPPRLCCQFNWSFTTIIDYLQSNHAVTYIKCILGLLGHKKVNID